MVIHRLSLIQFSLPWDIITQVAKLDFSSGLTVTTNLEEGQSELTKMTVVRNDQDLLVFSVSNPKTLWEPEPHSETDGSILTHIYQKQTLRYCLPETRYEINFSSSSEESEIVERDGLYHSGINQGSECTGAQEKDKHQAVIKSEPVEGIDNSSIDTNKLLREGIGTEKLQEDVIDDVSNHALINETGIKRDRRCNKHKSSFTNDLQKKRLDGSKASKPGSSDEEWTLSKYRLKPKKLDRRKKGRPRKTEGDSKANGQSIQLSLSKDKNKLQAQNMQKETKILKEKVTTRRTLKREKKKEEVSSVPEEVEYNKYYIKRRRRTERAKDPKKRLGRPPKRADTDLADMFKDQIKERKCKFCEEVFTELSKLRIHAKVQHESENGYKEYVEELGGYVYENASVCRFCQKLFTSLIDLRRHARMEHEQEEEFESYMKSIGGKAHVKTRKMFQCKLCVARSPVASDIYQHAKERHADTQEGTLYIQELLLDITLTCDQCGKNFLDKKSYYQHMRNVHPEELVACGICQSTFKTPMSLRHHMETIHGDQERKKFMCHLCPRIFMTVYKLRAHIKDVHVTTGPKFCPICNEKKTSKASLNRHIQTVHQNSRNHLCQHCGKAFYSSRDVEAHVRVVHEITSEEAKPHTCQYCSRKFAAFPNYHKHVKTVHLKQFSFNCKICDKGFPQGKPFRIHILKHHPELSHLAQDKTVRNVHLSDLEKLTKTANVNSKESGASEIPQVEDRQPDINITPTLQSSTNESLSTSSTSLTHNAPISHSQPVQDHLAWYPSTINLTHMGPFPDS